MQRIRSRPSSTSSGRFDNTQQTTGNIRDYAIVASYYDRSIAQHVLVVAGIGMAGTKAAAEFVTSNEDLQGWPAGPEPVQFRSRGK